MAKLITVHGTSEGLVADCGELWWQHGSGFLGRLQAQLHLEDVEVVPFHWGIGQNSASARRQAGLDLLRLMKSHDDAGADYYLIGHSHGGTVIYNALLQSATSGRRLERLQGWFTIGTPFIDIAPKRFLFSRLSPPGLVVYLICMVLIVTAASLLVSHFAGLGLARIIDERLREAALGHLYLPLLLLSGAAALSTHLALFLHDRHVNRWFSDSVKKRAAELYAGSWVGLFHDDDEAIAALRGAQSFSPQIVPRTFLAQSFAFLPVVLVVGVLGALLYHIEMQIVLPADSVRRLSEALASLGPDGLSGVGSWAGILSNAVGWLAALLAVFVLATIVVAGFKAAGLLLGAPLAGIIDRIVWSSVRQQIWGDDLIAESVRGVSVAPPFFAEIYRALPDDVADAITETSEQGADATLRRLRAELGMVRAAASGSDILTGALSKLSWRELIHTSYFEVDEFVRLLSMGLHLKGLASIRAEAWAPGQAAAARRAFAAIMVQGAARAGDVERVGSIGVVRGGGLDLSVTQKTLVSVGLLAGVFVGGMLMTAVLLPLAVAAAIWLGGAIGILVLAELLPVSTRMLASRPAPTSGFEEALVRFSGWTANEEAELHPRCRAQLMHHGHRTGKAYLLVHGISNCPFSMLDFAARLHVRGHNVLIARLPFNGHLDNSTDALRHVTAQVMREFADTGMDIAAGLGERVGVIGISAGGVVAAWMAQNRPEVERAVLIAPAFGLSSFGSGLNHALMRLALLVPNFSIWKDPLLRGRARVRPHSYKRQSSRGIGEVMRLGLGTLRQAARRPAAAAAITLVTNAADAAVDPAMSSQLVHIWKRHGVRVRCFEFGREHSLPHEIIDPTEQGAKTALVYPLIITLAEEPAFGAPELLSA